jgi:hypothetical protein
VERICFNERSNPDDEELGAQIVKVRWHLISRAALVCCCWRKSSYAIAITTSSRTMTSGTMRSWETRRGTGEILFRAFYISGAFVPWVRSKKNIAHIIVFPRS